jgi:hypothetical protein
MSASLPSRCAPPSTRRSRTLTRHDGELGRLSAEPVRILLSPNPYIDSMPYADGARQVVWDKKV